MVYYYGLASTLMPGWWSEQSRLEESIVQCEYDVILQSTLTWLECNVYAMRFLLACLYSLTFEKVASSKHWTKRKTLQWIFKRYHIGPNQIISLFIPFLFILRLSVRSLKLLVVKNNQIYFSVYYNFSSISKTFAENREIYLRDSNNPIAPTGVHCSLQFNFHTLNFLPNSTILLRKKERSIKHIHRDLWIMFLAANADTSSTWIY